MYTNYMTVIKEHHVVSALAAIKMNTECVEYRRLFNVLSQSITELIHDLAPDIHWFVNAGGWTGDHKAAVTKFHPETPTIVLSKDFILAASIGEATEVIFHAHAVAGEAAGHGPEWVNVCNMLGIEGDQYATRPGTVK